MGKVDHDVARLALHEIRARRGPITLPAGTSVPPGLRTYVVDGEVRINSHEAERWVRDLLRSDDPIKPIRGWA